MEQNENETLVISSGRFNFVRKYMTGIFLIICLIVLLLFWGFGYRESTLIKEQMLQQGRAFFQEIILTREWATNHGGVYVKLGPGVEVNPYLRNIPGVKSVITDQEGESYTLKNHAIITKEISTLAAQKGIFKFRITSLHPLNPSNSPDRFERTALEKFNQGVKEYFFYEQKGSEVLFRYMSPLIDEKSCLTCHTSHSLREGDIRGGISVTITATEMMQQLRENRIFLLVTALGIISLIFAIIRFISQVFIKQLNSAERKLMEMATSDFLTGLLNRRAMFNRLAVEIYRADRTGKPISIIMIDIDYFKKFNDTYGHSIGDLVLKELSRKLIETLRDYDIVCRYGGEEFLVVAPETTVESARELAERLRIIALDMVIPNDTEAEPVSVSISAGVAQMINGEDLDKTISRADAALYRAKEAGRNRVEVA